MSKHTIVSFILKLSLNASAMILAFAILLFTDGRIARGQQAPEEVISDAEKAEIIESVLDFELRIQALIPDFAHIRNVSSENLEFIDSTRLSKRGFRLVPATQIQRGWGLVEYLVFRKVSFQNGVALVDLSRMKEKRPCWAPASSTERGYTYEVRRTSDGWVAQLIKRPVQLISLS